jgi:tripartite-type tricarboxylate transporter receptor subunit TctC
MDQLRSLVPDVTDRLVHRPRLQDFIEARLRAERYARRYRRKLNNEITAGLADPKIKERLADLGGEAKPMTPAEFGKLITDETEKWAKVIRAANIKLK